MPLFKKGLETYDYTALQKRGLLKLPEQKKSVNMTKDGYVNIAETSASQSDSSLIDSASTQPQESQTQNPFNFLDNLASSSSSAPPSSNFTSQNSLEVSGLKNKLDDLEYKLDRLLERLSAIESRISSFEGNNEY